MWVLPMSEAGSNDVVDGLADRIRKRDWQEVGSLSLWSFVVRCPSGQGLTDY